MESRLEQWWSEERRPPAAYACELARDQFWRGDQLRLIAMHPEFGHDSGYATELLDLHEFLANALVLVLSRLPQAARRPFAEVVYEERHSGRDTAVPGDPRQRLAMAAAIALRVVDLTGRPDVFSDRVIDLLHGAAQQDDLDITPETGLHDVRTAVAKIRLDVDYEDPTDPRGAAATAIAEVLDPSSDVVALSEVLAKAAWATVESRERPQVLAFLLDADRIFADAGA